MRPPTQPPYRPAAGYAVKLINKEHVGTLEIQRLRQEAQIMQTLIHPNIISALGALRSATLPVARDPGQTASTLPPG